MSPLSALLSSRSAIRFVARGTPLGAPQSSGSVPEMEFSFAMKSCSEYPKGGSVPLNLLRCTSRCLRAGLATSEAGMVPEKRLEKRVVDCRMLALVKGGIVPLNALSLTPNWLMALERANPSGIVPERLFL